jgi:hypothetical protein
MLKGCQTLRLPFSENQIEPITPANAWATAGQPQNAGRFELFGPRRFACILQDGGWVSSSSLGIEYRQRVKPSDGIRLLLLLFLCKVRLLPSFVACDIEDQDTHPCLRDSHFPPKPCEQSRPRSTCDLYSSVSLLYISSGPLPRNATSQTEHNYPTPQNTASTSHVPREDHRQYAAVSTARIQQEVTIPKVAQQTNVYRTGCVRTASQKAASSRLSTLHLLLQSN